MGSRTQEKRSKSSWQWLDADGAERHYATIIGNPPSGINMADRYCAIVNRGDEVCRADLCQTLLQPDIAGARGSDVSADSPHHLSLSARLDSNPPGGDVFRTAIDAFGTAIIAHKKV